MKISDFSERVIKKWHEIYYGNMNEEQREKAIRNLPTGLFSEFGALYRSVLDHEVTEAQIKEKLHVVDNGEGGEGALSYSEFKNIRDNDLWSLREMSDYYRKHPGLYRDHSSRYRTEQLRSLNCHNR